MDANDFLTPEGDLEQDWFPEEEDVNARLTKYIQEGTSKATGLTSPSLEAAVAAWVYHRAYNAIYIRLSANPNSVSFTDQGARSYNQGQINSFRDLARDYLLEFNGYIAEVPQVPNTSTSHSLPNYYTW